MPRTLFREQVAELTARLAGRPLDSGLDAWLNDEYGPHSDGYRQLRQFCETGAAEGYLCDRDGGGIRYGYGRVFKPAADLHGLSVDMVDMKDIAGLLGAIYTGLVPVAVNTLLNADDYADMLEHSRAQAVLVSGALLPALNSTLTKSDHEVQKVIVSRPVAPLHPAEVEFAAFLRAQAPLAKPAATVPDDPAFWLYLSGSTGRPTGAVHSHANPYRIADVIGVPDAEGLTRTKAFVVPRAGSRTSAAELKAFVKDRLAPYKYPRAIEILDERPEPATGRIQRFRLRERELMAHRAAPKSRPLRVDRTP